MTTDTRRSPGRPSGYRVGEPHPARRRQSPGTGRDRRWAIALCTLSALSLAAILVAAS